mgnify:CR=1 FL=1
MFGQSDKGAASNFGKGDEFAYEPLLCGVLARQHERAACLQVTTLDGFECRTVVSANCPTEGITAPDHLIARLPQRFVFRNAQGHEGRITPGDDPLPVVDHEGRFRWLDRYPGSVPIFYSLFFGRLRTWEIVSRLIPRAEYHLKAWYEKVIVPGCEQIHNSPSQRAKTVDKQSVPSGRLNWYRVALKPGRPDPKESAGGESVGNHANCQWLWLEKGVLLTRRIMRLLQLRRKASPFKCGIDLRLRESSGMRLQLTKSPVHHSRCEIPRRPSPEESITPDSWISWPVIADGLHHGDRMIRTVLPDRLAPDLT